MSRLQATRLLLMPICHTAPPPSSGDVVRVTDGTTTVYLDPADYDAADETQLQSLLSDRARRQGDTLSTPDDGGSS